MEIAISPPERTGLSSKCDLYNTDPERLSGPPNAGCITIIPEFARVGVDSVPPVIFLSCSFFVFMVLCSIRIHTGQQKDLPLCAAAKHL